MKHGPKLRHHVLPRLYLKGFTERNSDKFLWVYERGRIYLPASGKHPGSGKGKFNPYKDSITSAGAERGAYYACKNDSGVTDYETYENILEKLEKPADPVLRKIRARQPLTTEDKRIFTSYILLMHRRGPQRNEEMAPQFWPKVVDDLSEQFERWSLASTHHRAGEVNREAQAMLDSRRSEMPDDIRLDSMVGPEGLVHQALFQMTWQFLVAP